MHYIHHLNQWSEHVLERQALWSASQTAPGSALNPLLFIILMAYVSRKKPMRKGEKLLYSDDIAIRAPSKEDLEGKVNQWYDQLSRHGRKMNMTKAEVMWVSRGATGKLDIEINGPWLNQSDQFKYLGGWVMEDSKLECELQSRLESAGWMWNNILDVAYDKHTPLTLRFQVFSATLDGAEAWIRYSRFNANRCLRWAVFA